MKASLRPKSQYEVFGPKTAIIDIAKASAFMNYGIICPALFWGRNDSQ
jgi:hypothetical protein